MNEFLAGGASGLTQTFVGHPFDTLKVRIQNQKYGLKLAPHKYFRGIGYPMISNTIVNSILFYQYDNLKTNTTSNFVAGMFAGAFVAPIIYLFDNGKALRQMGKKVTENNILRGNGFYTVMARESIAFSVYFGSYEIFKNDLGLHPLLAGALSGLSNWTVTYPIDVIRNRQIVNGISAKQAYLQGELWRGFSLCAVRALIVNSVGFHVYEQVANL